MNLLKIKIYSKCFWEKYTNRTKSQKIMIIQCDQINLSTIVLWTQCIYFMQHIYSPYATHKVKFCVHLYVYCRIVVFAAYKRKQKISPRKCDLFFIWRQRDLRCKFCCSMDANVIYYNRFYLCILCNRMCWKKRVVIISNHLLIPRLS